MKMQTFHWLRLPSLPVRVFRVAICLAAVIAMPWASAATTIFHNAVFLTMDESMSQAEAMAIRDGEILAVGGKEAVLSAAGGGRRHHALRYD